MAEARAWGRTWRRRTDRCETARAAHRTETAPSHARLAMRHSLVRVTLFLAGYFLILLAASVPKGMVPRAFADLTWGTLSSIGVLALTLWMLRRERRDRAAIGLRADARSGLRLLAGLLLGAAVYVTTIALSSAMLGPIHFTPISAPSVATYALVTLSFLALSCMEELGFRAYVLRTLIPTLGHWRAQLLTAVLFGLGHLLFGWSWASVLFGVVPSALLFGIAAARSGGLALPVGVHAAVNIASWTIGAKDTPGVWSPSVDPAHTARMEAYATYVGLAVTLLYAALLARLPQRASR